MAQSHKRKVDQCNVVRSNSHVVRMHRWGWETSRTRARAARAHLLDRLDVGAVDAWRAAVGQAVLERAARPDPELRKVDLARSAEFKSLLPQHKGQAAPVLDCCNPQQVMF